MISVKKAFSFFYLAAAFSVTTMLATSMTPTKKAQFKAEMHARLDRLGLIERKKARMQQRAPVNLKRCPIVKHEPKAKKTQKTAQQFVDRYLKSLDAIVKKIKRLPDETAANFALVMERIWQEAARIKSIDALLATISATGILDDETLLLVKLILACDKKEEHIDTLCKKGDSLDPSWSKTADKAKEEFMAFIKHKLKEAATKQPATVDALAALFDNMGV